MGDFLFDLLTGSDEAHWYVIEELHAEIKKNPGKLYTEEELFRALNIKRGSHFSKRSSALQEVFSKLRKHFILYFSSYHGMHYEERYCTWKYGVKGEICHIGSQWENKLEVFLFAVYYGNSWKYGGGEDPHGTCTGNVLAELSSQATASRFSLEEMSSKGLNISAFVIKSLYENYFYDIRRIYSSRDLYDSKRVKCEDWDMMIELENNRLFCRLMPSDRYFQKQAEAKIKRAELEKIAREKKEAAEKQRKIEESMFLRAKAIYAAAKQELQSGRCNGEEAGILLYFTERTTSHATEYLRHSGLKLISDSEMVKMEKVLSKLIGRRQ